MAAFHKPTMAQLTERHDVKEVAPLGPEALIPVGVEMADRQSSTSSSTYDNRTLLPTATPERERTRLNASMRSSTSNTRSALTVISSEMKSTDDGLRTSHHHIGRSSATHSPAQSLDCRVTSLIMQQPPLTFATG